MRGGQTGVLLGPVLLRGPGREQDVLGPGGGAGVSEPERDDHVQAGERLLDRAPSEQRRVPGFGLALSPARPAGVPPEDRDLR